MFITKRNKFARMFVNGGLKIPDKILKRETFAAAKDFSAPSILDLRGYCTPVENQGNLPYCAAYAATSFAENILWRKNHYHEEIDPLPIYKYAKSIDGDPTGAGTFLECAMEGLFKYKYFNPDVCKIKLFGGNPFNNGNAIRDMKFAIHQYGICMAGFAITSEWYSPNSKNMVTGIKGATGQGGHAVVVCGYNDELKAFLIMNSWGTSYAEKGFVWVSYDAFLEQFIYASTMTHCLDD